MEICSIQLVQMDIKVIKDYKMTQDAKCSLGSNSGDKIRCHPNMLIWCSRNISFFFFYSLMNSKSE